MAHALALAAALSLAFAEDSVYTTYTFAGKCGSLSYSGDAYDELFTTTVSGSSPDECGSLCEDSLGDSLVSVSASYDPTTTTSASVDCTCHSLCECLTDLDDPYLVALYYTGYTLPSACDGALTAAPAASTDSYLTAYDVAGVTGAPTTTPITALCEPDTDYAWEAVAVAGVTYSVVTIPAGLGKISLKVSGYAVEDVAVVKANETLPSYTSENATDSACDGVRPYWGAFDEHCSACSGEAEALKVETVFLIEGLVGSDYTDELESFFKASVDYVLAASYASVVETSALSLSEFGEKYSDELLLGGLDVDQYLGSAVLFNVTFADDSLSAAAAVDAVLAALVPAVAGGAMAAAFESYGESLGLDQIANYSLAVNETLVAMALLTVAYDAASTAAPVAAYSSEYDQNYDLYATPTDAPAGGRRRLEDGYSIFENKGYCYDPNEYDIYALTGTVHYTPEDCGGDCVDGAASMGLDLKGVRYDADSYYCACQTVCDCRVGLLDTATYALVPEGFDLEGLPVCYDTYPGYGCDGQSYVDGTTFDEDGAVDNYEECGDVCLDAITSTSGDSSNLAMAVYDGTNCLCYTDCDCMTEDSSLTSLAWAGTTVDAQCCVGLSPENCRTSTPTIAPTSFLDNANVKQYYGVGICSDGATYDETYVQTFLISAPLKSSQILAQAS